SRWAFVVAPSRSAFAIPTLTSAAEMTDMNSCGLALSSHSTSFPTLSRLDGANADMTFVSTRNIKNLLLGPAFCFAVECHSHLPGKTPTASRNSEYEQAF